MFSNDLSLNLIGVDLKILGQWTRNRKLSRKVPVLSTRSCPALTRAMSARGSGGSVTTRCRADYTWNDVAIDLCVLIQEPQSTFGIVTIRGAASLFVDTGSNHHQRCFRQIGIIPIDNCRLGTKRRPVTKISRDRLGAFKGSIHDDDVSGAAANHSRERTCTANLSRTNDSNLHDQMPMR